MSETGHNRTTPHFGRVVVLASLGGLEPITTVLGFRPTTAFQLP